MEMASIITHVLRRDMAWRKFNSNLSRFVRRGLDHFRFSSVWLNSHDLLRADGGNWRRRALRGKRCGRVASSSTVGGTRWSLSATHHLPPVNMAALTFNPLVLSAKASVRGAAVRRSVAVKASKKAAFAVRADDDMDFVSVFRPRPFPSLLSTVPERRAWRPTARASSDARRATDEASSDDRIARIRVARGVSDRRARRLRASPAPIRRFEARDLADASSPPPRPQHASHPATTRD